MTNKIQTINALETLLANVKCGGQMVTMYVEKPVSMNAFPTDGSEKVRRDKSFVANESYAVQFNYAADWDKRMSKLLGVDYTAHDKNSRHLVHNVLKQYISTGTICLIYQPNKYLYHTVVGADGKELTAQELAYMTRYKTKSTPSDYRNISVKYIKRLVINHNTYEIEIQ